MFGYTKKLNLLRTVLKEVVDTNLVLATEIRDLHRRQLSIEGFMRDAAAHNRHVQVLIDRIVELSMLAQGHPREAVAHRHTARTESQVKEDWNVPVEEEEEVWPPEGMTTLDSIG